MKRVLSLVLALVMVLGMIPMGFADGHTAGEELKGYGIIEGYEDGSLGEDKNLNRAEMMVVLARMMGKGAEAEAFALPSTFTDLEGFGWAVPWIAYAEMNEWTAGVGANMFNPAGNVTAQEAAVFMLKALGYEADVDFNWTNAVEFATAKGLFAGVDTAATSPILRGDLFTMMITTLNTEVKDGSALLGIKLGYMEVAELEVVSVKALNLVQIEVKFNMAVDADSAEDIDNYELTDADGEDLLDDWSEAAIAFDLQADGKTLVISHLGEAAGQQDDAVLEIDGVKSADKKLSIEDYVSDVFTYMDTTIPKAVKAEVIGINTIKVYFSEPIDADEFSADDFEVDGGDYVINATDTELVNNNTEANVALYSDLEEGTVKIEVSGMKDYAGFNVVKTTFEVKVVEDNDAPVVVGYKDAKTTGVTLIFNEDIKKFFDDEDKDEEDYFYHTNSNNVIDDAGWSIDGKNLKLSFDTNNLPEGTAYVYVVADAVQDYWENGNNRIIVKVEIEVDVTAPVLDKISVDLADNDVDVEIELTFSEDIDADTIEEDAFLIVDADGEEVGFSLPSEIVTTDKIVLTLDDPAEDVSGDFKITVMDLEDTSGNKIAKVTKTFTIDDLVAPDAEDFEAVLYNAGAKDQLIKINFDEKMATEGAYSVLNLSKYQVYVPIEGDWMDLEDLEVTPVIKLVDNGKAIEIKIHSLRDNNDGVDLEAPVVDGVKIGRVADAAGNKMTTLSGTIDLEEAGFVAVDEVRITGEKTIVIEFKDRLTTFKATDLKFYGDETTASALAITPSRISTSLNSDGDTVVTYRANESFDYNGEFNGSPVYLRIVGTASENTYGETLVLGSTTLAKDKYAPEIMKYAEAGSNTDYAGTLPKKDDLKVEIDYISTTEAAVYVYFTEAIDGDSISRLAFSVDKAVVDSIVLDGANVVKINIESESGKVFTKEDRLLVTQKYAIADESDNEFKSATTLRPFILK